MKQKKMIVGLAVVLLASGVLAQGRDTNTVAQLKAFREAFPKLTSGKSMTDESIQSAKVMLAELRTLPGLTVAEQWALGQNRLRIALVWAGRGDPDKWVAERWRDYCDALREEQKYAPNVFSAVQLELLYGDSIRTQFPEEEAEARRAWESVAKNIEAPPYFRFLALDKVARSQLYVAPRPAHLGANFPEIRTVAPESVRPEALDQAVTLWRKAIALPLASWVRLNGIVSVARAYESCGKPKEALAFIEAELPSVTDMTVREGAEINAIMAGLADTLGDRKKATALRKAVLAVPHVRPQLIEAVQAVRR